MSRQFGAGARPPASVRSWCERECSSGVRPLVLRAANRYPGVARRCTGAVGRGSLVGRVNSHQSTARCRAPASGDSCRVNLAPELALRRQFARGPSANGAPASLRAWCERRAASSPLKPPSAAGEAVTELVVAIPEGVHLQLRRSDRRREADHRLRIHRSTTGVRVAQDDDLLEEPPLGRGRSPGWTRFMEHHRRMMHRSPVRAIRQPAAFASVNCPTRGSIGT